MQAFKPKKRIKKSFRFTPETVKGLVRLSAKWRMTQTAVIENLVDGKAAA